MKTNTVYKQLYPIVVALFQSETKRITSTMKKMPADSSLGHLFIVEAYMDTSTIIIREALHLCGENFLVGYKIEILDAAIKDASTDVYDVYLNSFRVKQEETEENFSLPERPSEKEAAEAKQKIQQIVGFHRLNQQDRLPKEEVN